ncbi:GPI mannosyltransferase 4 [Periplaneta americana]|uniref:GPI mannosyltransferase 4 n=1 Tax=Periplaneta americana TaxID=6978 RepID=UPI0037E9AE17
MTENVKRERKDKNNGPPAYDELYTEMNLSLVPYWFLAALRVVITVIPQYGYIHPDEYFQSVEVVAGDVLDTEAARPWEFNTSFPLRSVVLPYAVVGLPLWCLKSVAPFISLWFDVDIKSPYLLLVLPRLAMCLLSFITDISLYGICHLYGQNYRARLLTLASSYVMLVYGTRTFSNTIEMALTSLLLYVVAHSMRHSDRVIIQDEYLTDKYKAAGSPVERVRLHKLRSALPSHSLSWCLVVATITVAGVFNRPTFLAFAFPPVFFWLQRGLGSKIVGLGDFHLRMVTFALCAMPATLLFILTDSWYYGYLTASEIREMRLGLGNFVVTPVNFIKYNLDARNLAKHGLHPRCLHLLVNVPLLYNVLGVVALGAFLSILYRGVQRRWSALPRVQSIIGLMTLSFVVPVLVLSLVPHQEPRFLIPITLPIVFLHAQRIRRVELRGGSGGPLLTVWYLANIVLTIFYGCLHQGGVYPLATHLARELHSAPRLVSVHLVTSHVYSLPLFPLQLRNSRRSLFSRQTGQRYRLARQFHLYELGSAPLEEVHLKLENLLDTCEQKRVQKRLDYRLYIALPASLIEEFHRTAPNTTVGLKFAVQRVFYPHVSTEALPDVFHVLSHECMNFDSHTHCDSETFYTSPLKFLSRLLQQFGLTLVKIER